MRCSSEADEEARPAAGRRQGLLDTERTGQGMARHGGVGLRRVPQALIANGTATAGCLCHHAALRRIQSPEHSRWPGRMWRENPQCLMQTHMAETGDEVRLDPGNVPRAPQLSRRSTITWHVRTPRGVRPRHLAGRGRASCQRLMPVVPPFAHLPDQNFSSWEAAPSMFSPR